MTEDVPRFLAHHGCEPTAAHCGAVAAEARRLARRFDGDPVAAGTAGWLHDASAVIPKRDRLRYAEVWGLPVLDEERALPMILHQKLSVVVGREIFGVRDPAVLAAVGCHTTLRAGAGRLDKVLFLADKIAWDQPGCPSYLSAVQDALTGEGAGALDAAVCVYLRFLWAQRATLPVIHPWLRAAHRELCPSAAV